MSVTWASPLTSFCIGRFCFKWLSLSCSTRFAILLTLWAKIYTPSLTVFNENAICFALPNVKSSSVIGLAWIIPNTKLVSQNLSANIHHTHSFQFHVVTVPRTRWIFLLPFVYVIGTSTALPFPMVLGRNDRKTRWRFGRTFSPSVHPARVSHTQMLYVSLPM